MFEKLSEKILNLANNLNREGIPLPMIRDPKTGKSSVTLTMFWLSFNVAIFTLAGKITKLIGDVDYQSVLWLFGLTGGFYLGRKVQKQSDGSFSIDGKQDKNKGEKNG